MANTFEVARWARFFVRPRPFDFRLAIEGPEELGLPAPAPEDTLTAFVGLLNLEISRQFVSVGDLPHNESERLLADEVSQKLIIT